MTNEENGRNRKNIRGEKHEEGNPAEQRERCVRIRIGHSFGERGSGKVEKGKHFRCAFFKRP